MIKHPIDYGEQEELDKFIEKANENGWVIDQVIVQGKYLTIIYKYGE